MNKKLHQLLNKSLIASEKLHKDTQALHITLALLTEQVYHSTSHGTPIPGSKYGKARKSTLGKRHD